MFLSLLFALSCKDPVLENVTKFPWNAYDKQTLQLAKARCSQMYSNSPCVTLFRKYGEKDYSVVCGGQK